MSRTFRSANSFRNLLTQVLALMALSVFGTAALGDVSPDPVNGGAKFVRFTDGTKGQTQVVMQHEIVKLKVSPKKCDVHVVFTMKNTGEKDETMPVGFPYGYKGELKNFSARVNETVFKIKEKEIERVIDQRTDEDGITFARRRSTYWMLWDMTFPAGKETKITVAYSTMLRDFNVPDFHLGGFSLSELIQTYRDKSRDQTAMKESLRRRQGLMDVKYVLKSGRNWHGPIGHCRIEVDFDGLSSDNVFPEDLKFETPTHAVWERTNFEPMQDFRLTFLKSMTFKEVDAFLTARLSAEPGHAPTRLFTAHFYDEIGRTAEAQRMMLDLYRDWQDRIVLFGPEVSREDVLRHSSAIWVSLQTYLWRNEKEIPGIEWRPVGIQYTDKQIQELALYARRMAKRVEVQLGQAETNSDSAKYYRQQVANMLNWCEQKLDRP